MDMKWMMSVEDREIEKVSKWMEAFDVDSREYESGMRLLERLSEIKEKRSRSKIKPEVWVPAVASIASILIVLNYEKVNVITSKAFNMIRK